MAKAKNAKKPAKKAAKKLARKPAKALKKKQLASLDFPKKGAYVRIQSKVLGESPKEYEFYLKDGRRLKSIYELVDALETMDDSLFREYANEAKNDFSSWIRDVFSEPGFAKEIHKVNDRIKMQKALMKKLIEETKRAASK